jgi:hypothetical protein
VAAVVEDAAVGTAAAAAAATNDEESDGERAERVATAIAAPWDESIWLSSLLLFSSLSIRPCGFPSLMAALLVTSESPVTTAAVLNARDAFRARTLSKYGAMDSLLSSLCK